MGSLQPSSPPSPHQLVDDFSAIETNPLAIQVPCPISD